jgi:c-di-GMP-binding flagellar brake protein YcgR
LCGDEELMVWAWARPLPLEMPRLQRRNFARLAAIGFVAIAFTVGIGVAGAKLAA